MGLSTDNYYKECLQGPQKGDSIDVYLLFIYLLLAQIRKGILSLVAYPSFFVRGLDLLFQKQFFFYLMFSSHPYLNI